MKNFAKASESVNMFAAMLNEIQDEPSLQPDQERDNYWQAMDKEVVQLTDKLRKDPKWFIPHLEERITRF